MTDLVFNLTEAPKEWKRSVQRAISKYRELKHYFLLPKTNCEHEKDFQPDKPYTLQLSSVLFY